MEVEEIKAQVKEKMKKDIDSVIAGEVRFVNLLYTRPGDVQTYIEELGGEEIDDSFQTNGWSWDYWVDYKLDGKKYGLFGDGFYSDTCKFELSD